jgi:o-succinylbenzoate synthase
MKFDLDGFALELARPLETARGTITHREGFLVCVEVDGTKGIGEATPLPGWTESIDECRDALDRASSVIESDGFDAALDAVMPSCPAARHGLSLAVFDMRAREAGQPLYRYLGGRECSSVPVNATIGDGSVKETVTAAERAVDHGYECLKCKVGVRSVDADVERLRAVRNAVGDIELRGDANGAWDRAQAIRAFKAFSEIGISYVEQPLPSDAVEGHAMLRKQVRELGGGDERVGVALDETLTQTSIESIVSEDAADVLVLKPMAVGGVDWVREIAVMAREAGMTPVVTTTIDGAYARAGAVHVAGSIPDIPACGLATGDRLADDFVLDPVPVDEGRITVPQGNGNGNMPRESNGTNA